MTRLAGRIGRRPSGPQLDAMLDRLAGVPVTYEHVGSTIDPEPRPSVRCTSLDVGSGRHTFDQAVRGLRLWLPQRGVGAKVHPGDAPLTVGTSLVVVLTAGPVTVMAPNRVVAVVDEPDRFAFAYGSLPGHPESGEESFSLQALADGTVRFTICVDAEPDTPLVRLAGPAVGWFQRRAIRRYLQAIADHVAAGNHADSA